MKVLIIGFGSIAKKHVQALREYDKSIEISALRSSEESEVHEGVQNIFTLDELKIYPDFIIISNPTYKHLDAIKQSLTFNKPLFIEKPLFHKLEGLSELVDLVNNKQINTYVACNLRFLDCLTFVKKHISENKCVINEVNAYCGSYLPEWRPETNYQESYSAKKEMGGGVHLDLIHELDYLYWIFGKPLTSSKKLSNKSSIRINSIDYANYSLEYNGFYASVILNYYRRDPKRTLEIVFDKETWLINILRNEITSLTTNEIIFRSDQKIIETYALQMNYFIESIKSQNKMSNSISEAYNVLEICLN